MSNQDNNKVKVVVPPLPTQELSTGYPSYETDGSSARSRLSDKDRYAAYVAVVGVTLHAVYFCALKQITMMSEMSQYEIMYHRSIWGLGILVFY